MKKIFGTLGAVGSVVATLFGAIDPTLLPPKYSAPVIVLGTLLAWFGKHPLEKSDGTK